MKRYRSDVGGEEKFEYPFALILRLRVLQVVCGISTMLMGAVALIEEKTILYLGLGVPSGISTVIAAAHNIYCSRGFDGYHPSDFKENSFWRRLRVFGPTVKVGCINIILWTATAALLIILITQAAAVLLPGAVFTISLKIIASTELLFSLCVFCTVIAIIWVDSQFDPDCQDSPDLAHSNTGTAVSMVTVSQAAAV